MALVSAFFYYSYVKSGSEPRETHPAIRLLYNHCNASVERQRSPMVRDGYYYAALFLAAALLVGWLIGPAWAIVPVLLAVFFLWFFRDPERTIPTTAGAVVSPGDGKVTDVSPVLVDGAQRERISIFLSVFDVHVNRSPVAGVVRSVRYQRGKYLNAMNAASADQNEQNIVTVEGDGQTVVFKQIAGLLARRIVFTKKLGDTVQRGERVGLIKFGSRVDVLLDPSATIQVKVGDRVKGGASVLAFQSSGREELAAVGHEVAREGGR
jgi:phosphatidylserine decarboxylase